MQKYRFADFELDLDAFELRLRGQPVKLERRPLDLLVLLVKRPGQLVQREEIIGSLWPSKVIIDFESGLNTLVRKLRNALGDSSEEPKFIETVPRRGYRFVAPVVVETDPESDRGSASHPSTHAGPARLLRSPRIAASLLIVVVATLLAWFAADTEHEPKRIAVLPFENLTSDEELAYLAAGLAEDTSTSLAQIDPTNLRVIGVATRPVPNAAFPVNETGRKLGVDFVVTSSLRRDGTRIRVTSRLLRTDDSEQIWSASIDRELTNVLGLQRELSIAIAEQVRLRLSPEVAAAIDRRQTQNPAAYALYLKGRYEWAQLTPASIRRALGYFEQATVEDPSYALAWAGLAFGAITSTVTADAAPAAVVPIARHALQRALELGPELAEAQYSKGYYSLFLDLDPHAAERAARLAIKLDPNNAQAYMLLGVTLPLLGQDVEAREMMRRSRELDPMFAIAYANSANVALQVGDPEEAVEFAKQSIAINPEFWVGHYHLGRALERLNDSAGALQKYVDAARLSGGHSQTYAARAGLLVRLDRASEARTLLSEMTERTARQYVPAYSIAVVHAVLGDTDAAFEWLERAIEVREWGLWSLPTDARLAPLHEDSRFQDLIARCACITEADRRH